MCMQDVTMKIYVVSESRLCFHDLRDNDFNFQYCEDSENRLARSEHLARQEKVDAEIQTTQKRIEYAIKTSTKNEGDKKSFSN